MSIFTGPGYLLTEMESEAQCPICKAMIDTGPAAEKAKYPCFNMRCPKCKGKITVQEPIFGGQLTCWVTGCPSNFTTSPNKVNGKAPNVPVEEDTENVTIPSASETAAAFIDRDYKIKKLLFSGAVFNMDADGRFMILSNGDIFKDYDYGFVIERAFYELKTDKEDDEGEQITA